MRIIVSTMPDQSVAITCPTEQVLMILREGGGVACVAHSPQHGTERLGLQVWLRTQVSIEEQQWFERTGYLPLRLAKAWEIEKHVREPQWRPDRSQAERLGIATRYIEALAHGGLTEDEAFEMIAQRDTPSFAKMVSIMDASALPTSRVHRNAWRRSLNGGPIYVDDLRAQEIDEERMWTERLRQAS